MEDLSSDHKFKAINHEAYLKVDKRLDRQERAEIRKRRRDGAADAAILQREELAD